MTSNKTKKSTGETGTGTSTSASNSLDKCDIFTKANNAITQGGYIKFIEPYPYSDYPDPLAWKAPHFCVETPQLNQLTYTQLLAGDESPEKIESFIVSVKDKDYRLSVLTENQVVVIFKNSIHFEQTSFSTPVLEFFLKVSKAFARELEALQNSSGLTAKGLEPNLKEAVDDVDVDNPPKEFSKSIDSLLKEELKILAKLKEKK